MFAALFPTSILGSLRYITLESLTQIVGIEILAAPIVKGFQYQFEDTYGRICYIIATGYRLLRTRLVVGRVLATEILKRKLAVCDSMHSRAGILLATEAVCIEFFPPI
jgi:hypothetical protein